MDDVDRRGRSGRRWGRYFFLPLGVVLIAAWCAAVLVAGYGLSWQFTVVITAVVMGGWVLVAWVVTGQSQ